MIEMLTIIKKEKHMSNVGLPSELSKNDTNLHIELTFFTIKARCYGTKPFKNQR